MSPTPERKVRLGLLSVALLLSWCCSLGAWLVRCFCYDPALQAGQEFERGGSYWLRQMCTSSERAGQVSESHNALRECNVTCVHCGAPGQTQLWTLVQLG